MNEHVDFFSLIRVVNVDSLFNVSWGAVYECPRLLSAVIILRRFSNTFRIINFILHILLYRNPCLFCLML